MDQKIASRFLKISQGKTEISKDLPVGTYDVSVLIKGDIVKQEYLDQQDGTVDVVYVLKATDMEIKND